MNLKVILPSIAAILTPIITYLLGRRKTSGKVATTEAATLWAEAERMREVYRVDATQLRTESAALRAEVQSLREEVLTLRVETLSLRREAERWQLEAQQLREKMASGRRKTDRAVSDLPSTTRKRRSNE